LIEARQPEAMRTQGRFSLFLSVGTRHEGYAEDQPRISYGGLQSRVRCVAICLIALSVALSDQETSASKQLAAPLQYTRLLTDLWERISLVRRQLILQKKRGYGDTEESETKMWVHNEFSSKVVLKTAIHWDPRERSRQSG
jgi:hypothetical protein